MEKQCDCPDPDDVRTGALERIEKFGMTFMGVFPDEKQPGFVYSIGLTLQDLPEVIVSMSDVKTGHQIAGAVAEAFAQGKTDLGRRLDLFNVPVLLVELQQSIFDTHMNWAKEILNTDFAKDDLRAVQVIWPDVNGKFPGDVPDDEFVGPQMLYSTKQESSSVH